MRRKFLTNLIFLMVLNFMVKPFWIFGIDMTVQNRVGPSEYGLFFAIFNFALIIQIILDLGISNFNNKNIAQNNQLLTKHFNGILVLRFVFSIVYLVAIMLLGYLVGYGERELYLLLVMGLNQLLLTLILYFRSNISALLLLRTDSVISVLDKALMIVICGVLLWGEVLPGNFTIELFVYSQTISYVLTAIIAFGVVYSKIDRFKLNWNLSFFKAILKQSWPYALLILLMGIYSRVDSILLERLLPEGDYHAGIYASAFRLLDAANNMSGFLFASLLLPIFAKLIKEKSSPVLIVKLSFTILYMLSITIAISSIFYGSHIMSLFYHNYAGEDILMYELRIDETYKVFVLLMWTYIATSITYIFGTLLTANGSLKLLNWVALSGVILSLVVNFTLIPVFEATGAAMASLVSQWVTALAQLIIAMRMFKMKADKVFVFKLLAFGLFVLAANIITYKIQIPWVYNFALVLIFSTIVAIMLRLINLRTLFSILRTEK